jgi:hypothetical protein
MRVEHPVYRANIISRRKICFGRCLSPPEKVYGSAFSLVPFCTGKQAERGMLSNAKKCLKTHTCNSILHVCNTLLPHVGAVEVESITLHWRAPASACARNVVHTPCVISDLLRARTYTHTRTLYTHATYTHSACTPAGLIDFELFGEARCKYVVTA